MKLTKKIETEVLKVYDTWLHSYLNGDVETYDFYFDDDYHFIGSTKNEEFLNRKGTTNFFKATANQLAGKTQLRNETKIIEKFEELVFITHLFDAWFLNGADWSYYGRFRFTNALKNNKEGWRFIYQHFSTTDSKAQEGETIGFDQISAENLQLRQAVKRRTTELEQKNRELEVETALERVRAVAMSMYTSKGITNSVNAVFKELEKLGLDTIRCGIGIFDDETNKVNVWTASSDESEKIANLSGDENLEGHPLLELIYDHWLLQKDLSYILKDKDLIDYYKKTSKSNFPVEAPDLNKNIETQYYHCTMFPAGGLFAFRETGFSEEVKYLMKRFSEVFHLSFIRHQDLKKAEIQVRETNIELALERVRARTMSMQRSDELTDTSMLLFQQIEELGINSFACGFNIWDDDKKAATAWMASKDRLQPPFKTNSSEDVYVLFHEAEKRGESLFILEQKGKELEEHYKYLVTIPEVKKLSEAGLSFPTFQIIHCAYFSKGYLMFITLEPVPDAHDIFKRFARVFEQTYTRFLDLQKVEAQAREAKIEAALERVRAKGMEMRNTFELQEVVNTLAQQFHSMKMDITGVFIAIANQEIDKEFTFWGSSGVAETYLKKATIPFLDRPIYTVLAKAIKTNKGFFTEEYTREEKIEFFKHMFKHPPFNSSTSEWKEQVLTREGDYTRSVFVSHYTTIFVVNHNGRKLSDSDNEILKRFGKIFEQSYIRFLDLQKAEAQAREAHIETALEKVRSRSMGMQESEELKEVIQVVYDQFVTLNIYIEHTGFILDYKEREDMHIWLADLHEVPTEVSFPYFDTAHWNSFIEAKEKGMDFFVNHLTFEEKNKFYNQLFKLIPGVPKETINYYLSCPGLAISTVLLDNIGLYIENFKGIPYTDEENSILMRFGKVFQQTYTRFLDLQKAEEQAREAQIEVALERVRAKAMAMHSSKDISGATVVVFNELGKLGIDFERCGIAIFNDTPVIEVWSTPLLHNSTEVVDIVAGNLNTDIHPLLKGSYKAWSGKKKYYSYELKGKELKKYYALLEKAPDYRFPKIENYPETQIINSFYFNEGAIFIYRRQALSEETKQILYRFTSVFSLTYRRYLDIIRAEAQAREAEIELALERVRARTMAMQHSDELQEASFLLDQQVRGLGIKTWGCAFNIYGEKESTEWFGNEAGVLPKYKVPRTGIFKEYYQKGQKGESLIIKEFSGEACVAHYEYMSSLPIIGDVLKKLKETNNGFPTYQIDHIVYFKYGYLLFITREPAPDAHDIFKRFAKVFEQTYTRFLDLQKAEAQTRESQIEAALERVRSRTLAMQSSGELAETAVVVFKQLIDLGIEPNRLYIGIVKEDNGLIEMWATDEDATEIGSKVDFDITKNKSISKIFDGWKKQQKSLNLTMEGKELQTYLKYIYEELGIIVQKGLSQKKRFQTIAYFSKGFIGIAAPEEQPESTTDLLERFASVFNLTYTRFNDLQISEAQIREAKIEIALERVRSRTMGMQKSDELAETSAVLFQQIKEIATETWSCGFCIWQENDEVELWMGADSGGLLPPMLIPYKKEPTHKDIYEASLRKEPAYNKVWNGKELKEHYAFLRTIPSVAKAIKIMKDSGLTLPDQQCYYVGFFKHGYLLLITKEPNDDLIELSTRFTKVFDLTYTRFLDLQLKEKQSIELLAEKKRLEVTLTDLQATQKQLIQSEKMASLGELTAGIAHEIQNPLNFVNNFSEVSQELIDELKEELELGHMDGVKDILNDVIHNLQKIAHHGKRADGIVKGMLQHSRKSSAVKEATDINTLCDEFLRLSYHGLRAKDKSFNATLVTDFDENLPKVNIFPQELGRVILNLLTNAFYAVNEKKQLNITGYNPKVSIGTKDNNGSVEIKVSDNGNGIPKHVLEKIYQPFFTTKPTGQGTGLGLSMSYDIITKGHGGSLKVLTENGKGTEFIIELPLKQTVKMY